MTTVRLRRSSGRALAAVGALAVLVALAGCASGSGDSGSSAAPSTAGQLPPVIVDLGEVDGTTVEVALGNSIDLVGDDVHYATWEADIADPSIVEFVPGRDDGSAQFNPGLTATAVGETEVELSNSHSGDEVAFTVVVTE